jgi:hypothetical protein
VTENLTAPSLKRCFVSIMALILVLVGLAAPASADPVSPESPSYTWNVRSPIPTSNGLTDIVFVDGSFITVGSLGTILTSNDGVEWQSHSPITTAYLTAIAHSNDMLVAVGTEGAIIFSEDDGSTWTSRTSGTGTFWDVVYGDGKFVAVGDTGKIVTSPDGKNWTVQISNTTKLLTGIEYGANGIFIAVGSSGTVLASTDGSTWSVTVTSGIASTTNLTSVINENGGFLAVGNNGIILASDDGTNWISQTAAPVRNYNEVTYTNGIYLIAAGASTLLSSSDRENWTGQSLNLPYAGQISMQAIAYGNGTYIAVGDRGTIVTSVDGVNWIKSNKGTGYNLNDVAYHEGTYVAVGDVGVILTSEDGTDWSYRVSDVGQTLYGVVYGDGIFMAVGGRGTMVTSSDGESFTTQTMQVPDTIANNLSVLDVTYGNGTFVAAGGVTGGKDLILVSKDKGESWTKHSLDTTNNNRGVSFGNDTFIVVGTLAMGVSKDGGTTWTIIESMKDYYDVTYAKGIFVAVGGQGKIATSTDGITWQTHNQSSTLSFKGGVTYADNTFLAVGAVGTAGRVATSSEGINWTIHSAGAAEELLRVVHGNNGFVAVGKNGTIIQSSTAAPDLSTVGIDVSSGLLTGTSAQMEYSLNSTDGTDGTWLTATGGSTSVAFGPSPGIYVRDSLNPSALRKVGSIPDPASTPNVTADLGGGLSTVKLIGATMEMEYSLDGGSTWNVVTSGLAGGTETIDAGALGADLRVRVVATASLLPSQMTGTLNSLTLAVTRHPDNATAAPGGSATFSVQATGVNLTYQWQFDLIGNGTFINMPLSTSSSLTLVNLTEQQNGQRFRVVVTGNGGSVTSNVATLTVSAQPGAWVSQATRGNEEVRLDWNSVAGATNYGVYVATVPGQYGSEPLATVTSSTYTVTGLSNGTPYYFKIQAHDATDILAESIEVQVTPATVPGAPTDVAVTAGNGLATVTFRAPADNGGSPITDYEVTAMPGNVTASGSGSPITVTGLTNGTSYTFTVKAINGVDKSEATTLSNAVTPTAPASGDSGNSGNQGGNGSPSQPITTIPSADHGAEVLVNGKPENAGTVVTEESGGRRVTTIVVDEQKLQQRLDAEGMRAVITIPVNSGSEVVVGELNGRMVKNMEARQAVIEIRTEQASYMLPALQISMDDLAKRFGTNLELQDIQIRIEIAMPSTVMLQVAADSASAQGLTIITPPLEFSVKAIYGGKVEEIAKFDTYVQRTLAIPAGVDPNRITTGVVVDLDGTVRHVPTTIIVKDGKYYAQINSLTNSAYSVVWHPLEFQDTAAHWAKDAINDMGSRMVVNGTGAGLFSPDRDITRAEFAAIMVRGLGLRPENVETVYSDVKSTDWFAGAVQTASEYRLISGFGDGTFRPDERITREQAMKILANAISITKLQGMKSGQSANSILSAFSDAIDVSNWALNSVADSVSAGIISGRSSEFLAPKAYMTRAEVASIMQRLLQKSGLINE